jgi:hypothetical protein
VRSIVPAVVFLALAIGIPAKADAYNLIGAGNSSCGTWTAERAHPDQPLPLLLTSWVVGFLSGIGWVGQDGDNPLHGVDAEGVWAWVDNYCKAHPIDTIAKGASQFYWAHRR